ncbi:DNA mismatch repair protein Mlh1 [Sorochytrium milnesiophthora]
MTQLAMSSAEEERRRIRRLDETVVNRIAAGEVVHQPAHALKELLENSIDAGATAITITAKEGGIKLLQIVDNGCGIQKDDLPIVCERFTTSKLRDFDEISNLATFGFRGEALASISHVAHVTITTKTADAQCAYRAQYSDGKLVPPKPGQSADPKPCAGNTGTTITVEDLFYNVPTRRKTLRSASEEYAKIVDVVSRFAIHNPGVAFTVKKHGSTAVDVNTRASASTLDNISTIYGSPVAKELLEMEVESEQLEFTARAWISNANWSARKMGWILFINNRPVESTALKRAIDAVYAEYLPKGSHPWVYVSLRIKPQNVDVNVHPTKKEVRYLHEDNIVAFITSAIQERLASADTSRVFTTQLMAQPEAQQTRLIMASSGPEVAPSAGPSKRLAVFADLDGEPAAQTVDDLVDLSSLSTPAPKFKPYDYHLVRTDSRSRTLESFGFSSQAALVAKSPVQLPHVEEIQPPTTPTYVLNILRLAYLALIAAAVRTTTPRAATQSVSQVATVSETPRRSIRLTSVLTLRSECEEQSHAELQDMFRNHTFVGCVDGCFALVQHQTRLYMINYQEASIALFYQLALHDFANFGNLMLSEPAPIRELVLLALNEEEISDWDPTMMPKSDIAAAITDTIVSRRDMLFDYFSMRISEAGELLSLPMLWKSYPLVVDKLPLFLLRLGTEVDWDSEKGCFHTVCFEIALLYAPLPPVDVSSSAPAPATLGADSEQPDAEMEKYMSSIEHTLFGQLLRWPHFCPSKQLADDGHVVQIANLHELYKVFERC